MKYLAAILSFYFAFLPAIIEAANTHAADLEASSLQYFTVTDNTALSVTGSICIQAWINTESIGVENQIVNKFKTGSTNDRGYSFYLTSTALGASFCATNACSGADSLTPSYTFTPTNGQWYFVEASFDSSLGDAFLYVDDTQVASALGTMSALNNNTANFTIGAYLETSPSSIGGYFDGKIDEVRVWDVPCTNVAVADKCSEPTGSETNLRGYWKLNNNANDTDTAGSNLTPFGSPTYVTDIPTCASASSGNVIANGSFIANGSDIAQ